MIFTDPWLERLHGASILEMFRLLSKYGYKVKIFVPSSKIGIIAGKFISVIGFRVKKVHSLLHINLFTFASFKTLPSEKPIVLIFKYSMLSLAMLCEVLWSVKCIMMILSRPICVRGFLGFLRFTLFRLSLLFRRSFVDAFTAITSFEAYEFSRLGKIPIEKSWSCLLL